MKSKLFGAIVACAAVATIAASPAAAQDRILKIATFAPGSAQFIIHNAIANAVNNHVDGTSMEVSATGAATQHMVQVANGEIDFSLTSLISLRLMSGQRGPFQNLSNGAELAPKLLSIMAHPIGARHFVVYADSGINSFADIADKKVFLGPPAGTAVSQTSAIIMSQAGLEAGADFEQISLGWGPAVQAFQDRQLDVLAIPGNVPDPRILNMIQTNDLRLLSVEENDATAGILRNPINFLTTTSSADYGSGIKNDGDIVMFNAVVNVAVRADLDEETVYQVVKAFWENIDDAWALAPWMEGNVNLESALSVIPGGLHPGAERYYREIGLDIPNALPIGG